MTIIDNEEVDITDLVPHFPWEQVSVDRGFVMGYPEVMMVSDYMQTLFTQVSALLLNLSWEVDNQALYSIEEAESSIPTERILVNVQLGTVDEVWEAIEMPQEKLTEYLTLAVVDYLKKYRYAEDAKIVRLEENLFLAINASSSHQAE